MLRGRTKLDLGLGLRGMLVEECQFSASYGAQGTAEPEP